MKLVVLDLIAYGPNLQKTWPERATRQCGEEAGVRFIPKMGLGPASVGCPSGPLGEALFQGKHVTLYISSRIPNYGFVKKSLPTDICQISLRYLSAALLIFIKDRSGGWAAEYRQ
jgi:hypothetical protein